MRVCHTHNRHGNVHYVRGVVEKNATKRWHRANSGIEQRDTEIKVCHGLFDLYHLWEKGPIRYSLT